MKQKKILFEIGEAEKAFNQKIGLKFFFSATLLNALAYRSPDGIKISGVRTINGNYVDASQMRSHCAYVQQDDLFIGTLTAREHLIFQAMLRMERKTPKHEKMARVDAVLNELSLRKCENTIIGVPGRLKGLSGGKICVISFDS